MRSSYFSRDIREFFIMLYKHKVKYLIVGGEAVIYYGHARLTGDIDIFYELSEKNVKKMYNALNEFWSNNIPGINGEVELYQKGLIIQFGVPPNRIDLLNSVDGIEFKEAWKNKKTEKLRIYNKTIDIYYIGLKELIKNKERMKRAKDIDDLRFLRERLRNEE